MPIQNPIITEASKNPIISRRKILLNYLECFRRIPIQATPWKSQNHQLNTIFIHIPKNAGISVEKTIFTETVGHFPLYLYQFFNRKKYNSAFKFCFTRNPYDRLVSAFHFLKQGGMNQKDAEWSKQHLQDIDNFSEFMNKLANLKNFRNIVLQQVHFVPQHYFIVDLNGKIGCDFIGQFENFNNDFSLICRKQKIQRNPEQHNNSGRKKEYKEYYSEKDIETAQSMYKKDLELFNYKF